MKPGSVIVDLAVEQGGNCPLSRPGEVVDHQPGYQDHRPFWNVPSRIADRRLGALRLPATCWPSRRRWSPKRAWAGRLKIDWSEPDRRRHAALTRERADHPSAIRTSAHMETRPGRRRRRRASPPRPSRPELRDRSIGSTSSHRGRTAQAGGRTAQPSGWTCSMARLPKWRHKHPGASQNFLGVMGITVFVPGDLRRLLCSVRQRDPGAAFAADGRHQRDLLRHRRRRADRRRAGGVRHVQDIRGLAAVVLASINIFARLHRLPAHAGDVPQEETRGRLKVEISWCRKTLAYLRCGDLFPSWSPCAACPAR